MANISFANKEELEAYLATMKEEIIKTLSASKVVSNSDPPRVQTDALGQRDVVAQATASVQRAPTSHAGPSSEPEKKMVFAKNADAESMNAIRLAIGTSDPFSDVPQFGDNTYYPDFSMNHLIVDEMNKLIQSNKRFYDVSTIWHPLMTHIYIGILEFIQVMRAMRVAGLLDLANTTFLSWFEENFPLHTLPVPGPLVNSFVALATSSPAIQSYNNVCPILPQTTHASINNLCVPRLGAPAAANGPVDTLSMRWPIVPALLDQYRRLVTYANTAAGGPPAALPTASAIAQWPSFGANIMGFAALGAAPANAFEQTALVGGAFPTTQALFATPGFSRPTYTSRSVGQNIQDNAAMILSVLPDNFAVNAAPAILTWQRFLRLDGNTRWLNEFTNQMAIFCKHFSSSTSLGEISPTGCMSGQVRFARVNPLAALPAARFPAIDYSVQGGLQNLAIPEADRLDAAVAISNLTHFGPVVAGGTEIRTGPYFENLPILKRTRTIIPNSGISQVISTRYFITAAK